MPSLSHKSTIPAFSAVAEKTPAIAINEYIPNDISGPFFGVRGGFVLPRTIEQAAETPNELWKKADGSDSRYLLKKFLHAAADHAGADPETTTTIAPTKTWDRFIEKSEGEKNNSWQSVLDLCRGNMLFNSLEEIDRVADFLRPSNNPNVVSFVDNLAVPDNRRGLRRIKANIRLANELVAEVMVGHRGMEPFYAQSHTLYKEVRTNEDMMEIANRELKSITQRLEETSRELQNLADSPEILNLRVKQLELIRQSNDCRERAKEPNEECHKLHKEGAERTGLNSLIEKRDYYMVGNKAVMVTERAYDGKRVALRAIPETGLYMPDNGLLRAIDSNPHRFRTTEEDFIITSILAVAEHKDKLASSSLSQQAFKPMIA